MKTMSYTESRARYAEVLDSVTDDREEVVITRAGHEPVVIVSLEDYDVLDVSLSYDVSDALELYGRVQNAADERYQEVRGFNAAERSIYGGARLRF